MYTELENGGNEYIEIQNFTQKIVIVNSFKNMHKYILT